MWRKKGVRRIRRNRKEFKSKRFSKALIFVFIILVLISVFLLGGSFLTIKSFDVKLDKIDCVDESKIRESVKILGQNFFLVNKSSIKENLKNNFLCIGSVEINKIFPGKAVLVISSRVPVAVLAHLDPEATFSAQISDSVATSSAESSSSASPLDNLKSDNQFLVDKDQVIFAPAEGDTPLPKLYFQGDVVSIGRKISGSFLDKSLKILVALKSFKIEPYRSLVMGDREFLVRAGFDMVFNLNKDINLQLASLQLILEKAKMNGEKIKLIDLRFDKPVVKYDSRKK